jgi:hypothetical protein
MYDVSGLSGINFIEHGKFECPRVFNSRLDSNSLVTLTREHDNSTCLPELAYTEEHHNSQ